MGTGKIMSKKIFTEKETKQLSANQYVKAVSTKGITYTDEFKHIFISEREEGKPARDISIILREFNKSLKSHINIRYFRENKQIKWKKLILIIFILWVKRYMNCFRGDEPGH